MISDRITSDKKTLQDLQASETRAAGQFAYKDYRGTSGAADSVGGSTTTRSREAQ